MGVKINMKDFFNNFYNVLFSPNEAFVNLKNSGDIFDSVFVVILTAIFMYLQQNNFAYDEVLIVFNCLWAIVCALFFWFIFCWFADSVAGIFSHGGKLKTLMRLVAYSGLPWLLFAPLNLLKEVGGLGYFVAVCLQTVIAFYVLYLYIKSVKEVYDLSFLKAFAFFSIPLFGSFFALLWTIGFFSKMIYIFSV